MIGQIVLGLVASLLAVAVVGGGVSAIRRDLRDLRSTPKGGNR